MIFLSMSTRMKQRLTVIEVVFEALGCFGHTLFLVWHLEHLHLARGVGCQP